MLDKDKKRPRRMHTREFKADLVALVRAGRSVAQVAKDFRASTLTEIDPGSARVN
jgi:transposase-like protein